MAGRERGGRAPPPAARHASREPQRHGDGGQDVAARRARSSGQHVLHDQRSARHNRRHVLPELCVHTAHNDVRALFHRPVESQKVNGVNRISA